MGDRRRLVVDDTGSDLELIDEEQLAGIALAPARASSSVSGWSGPTDAVPVRTGRPSVVCASIVAVPSPVVVNDAWTCSPATTMFRK